MYFLIGTVVGAIVGAKFKTEVTQAEKFIVREAKAAWKKYGPK